MLLSYSRILSLLSVSLFALANGQFGSDLLAFVPAECQQADNFGDGHELNDVLDCVLSPRNIFGCLGLASVLDPDLIPDPQNITDCGDVEEPYCEIEAECEACSQVIQDLMRCIVVYTEGVDGNITDLVETCPLDCSL